MIIIKTLTVFTLIAFIIISVIKSNIAWFYLFLISSGTYIRYLYEDIDPFSLIILGSTAIISTILTVVYYLQIKHPNWYKKS